MGKWRDKAGYWKRLFANSCVQWRGWNTELKVKLGEALQQRDYAGRLYWKMRAERDMARGEATQHSLTATYFEVKYEAANARIAELEAQLAERDKRTCETCRFDLPQRLCVAGITRSADRIRRKQFCCSEWQERGR